MSLDRAVVAPFPTGNADAYVLDARPIASGGQATVFAATHKPTNRRVAFKRLYNGAAIPRMKREIEAARRFGDHPNVMPLLDFSPDFDWFVMPLAEASALDRAKELRDTEPLRELVGAICAALRRPHAEGWVHRDLKPDNLLWLDGRWMVADWGLGRRPRGKTTEARRTVAGMFLGTEGFAAPELSIDAHEAGARADIYSIGQIIGWAVTGRWPQANVPLLPDGGAWRVIVRAATAYDTEHRLGTVDDLLATLTSELDGPEQVIQRARQLVVDAEGGDLEAPSQLLLLAAHALETREVLHEGLLRLNDEQTRTAIAADTASATAIVRSLRQRNAHNATSAADDRRVIAWLLAVADHAEKHDHRDLLDDASESILLLSGRASDTAMLSGVADWIGTRTGPAASGLVTTMRRVPANPEIGRILADRPGVDPRVRHTLPRQPGRGSAPPERQGLLRRGRALVAVPAATALLALSTIVVVQFADRDPPGGAPATQSNPETGVPREPSALALLEMKKFVAPWDKFPTWHACRSGTGDTAVTGSFPASPGPQVTPSESIYCENGPDGGSMSVRFADFRTQTDYEKVRDRYLAAPPERPAEDQESPPIGLHVFRWSPKERAAIWTDEKQGFIGILITNSGTNLVDVWETYPS